MPPSSVPVEPVPVEPVLVLDAAVPVDPPVPDVADVPVDPPVADASGETGLTESLLVQPATAADRPVKSKRAGVTSRYLLMAELRSPLQSGFVAAALSWHPSWVAKTTDHDGSGDVDGRGNDCVIVQVDRRTARVRD